MEAKRQAFKDMRKEFEEEGRVLITASKRQLGFFFFLLDMEETVDCYDSFQP